MAVQIEGIQVRWGIPGALKTSADALVLGIVQNISLNRAGSVENIADEDGDLVTRVDHGRHNTGSITTMMVTPGMGTPALPAKGLEITGLAAIDGVALNTGHVFVDDASITYSGTAGTQVTIPFTHYPDM